MKLSRFCLEYEKRDKGTGDMRGVIKRDRILIFVSILYLLLFSIFGQLWLMQLFVFEKLPTGVWFETLVVKPLQILNLVLPILCLCKIVSIEHRGAKQRGTGCSNDNGNKMTNPVIINALSLKRNWRNILGLFYMMSWFMIGASLLLYYVATSGCFNFQTMAARMVSSLALVLLFIAAYCIAIQWEVNSVKLRVKVGEMELLGHNPTTHSEDREKTTEK
jgi:hypothetical protein